METAVVLGAALLMALGTGVLIVGIVRSLGHSWEFGLYELWVLPVVGAGLLLLGVWMMR